MSDSKKWIDRFLFEALVTSTYSKDPSTKVGCVLTNDQNKIVSKGYNGFSRKSPDHQNWLEDRSKKYPRTIHAEENAIYNAISSVYGCIAFLTHPPCVPCLNRLSHVDIMTVFCFGPPPGFEDRWKLYDSQEEAEELEMNLYVFDYNNKKRLLNEFTQSLTEVIIG